MSKNLVIVESPAKAKTIEGFLGKDYLVRSSFGHVRDLAAKELGVDVDHGFKPRYIIMPDKKKVVSELKKLADAAEMIWLATDEDREGEAISWHLSEALNLKADKTKRIVFHEITRSAITAAIENPRSIDINLVNAQQARRVLDRLVGFEISPILWRKVKPALSAGRVQSVAVRLIVEREEEIRNFKSTFTYKISAIFLVDNEYGKAEITADLPKRFKTKEEARAFLESCLGAIFTVANIESKPGKKSPAPPFTTSTLQQEASRKLGFSVSKTMMVAQQLYESGKITYMRTDSVNLSVMALGMAKEEVTRLFGKEYHKSRQYTTRTKGAQEAHEAIRPTYLSHQQVEGDTSQRRLYDLIWKRTIASQMADAILERTIITIDVSTVKEQFIAEGEVIKFDGFLKVYMESSDEDTEKTEGILPVVKKGEKLGLIEMSATQKFAQQPPRYTEASLVKKMEDLGIGRPSTYAPTISTIQKREYVEKSEKEGVVRNFDYLVMKDGKIRETVKHEKTGYEKGKLVPTDIGELVTRFLVQSFNDVMDYNFTATVEKEFDSIAQGLEEWNHIIRQFYGPFHKKVEESLENKEKVKGERLLGIDPVSKQKVTVKIGRFGPMAQIGDTDSVEKPRFASMKKGQSLESITIEEALSLFDFPRKLGEYEGAELTVAIGRFGPFVKHNSAYYSLKKTDDPATIDAARAVELIHEKHAQEANRTIREFESRPDVKVLNGRYGPYISIGKDNYRIPKGTDPSSLTLEDCLKISASSESTSKKKAPPRKGKK